MKIHASNSQPVSQVSGVPKVFSDSTPPPATAVSESPPSHVVVSGPGQLISRLMQLKQEAPDKFEEVVSGLATSLKDTVESLDGRAARRLDSLANKLDDIAQGGDIGQLARRDHGHHHAARHGHHHGHHHGFGRIDGEGHGVSDDASLPPVADVPSDAAAASGPATTPVTTTPEMPAVLPIETDGETSTAVAAPTSAEQENAVDVHQAPTLAPAAAEDAAPTVPWNPPPALRAFGRLGGPSDDTDDREVIRTAFADLLRQLDAALAG